MSSAVIQRSLFADPESLAGPVTAPFSDATFSPCGIYRYTLTRIWRPGPQPRLVNWVMLNPSKAGRDNNDHTATKIISFSQRFGYDGLIGTNLFGFRATDPKNMKAAVDPIGPDNDRVLLEIASQADLIICAWGTHGGHQGRSAEVRRLLADYELHALSFCKDGEPGHPLMLSYAHTPERWEP